MPATARKKETAKDQDFINETADQVFDAKKLSREEQEQARQISEATSALIYKALLNRKDSKTFPIALTQGFDNAEAQAAAFVQAIPERLFAKVSKKLDVVSKDKTQLQKMLGDNADIDFKAVDISKSLKLKPKTGKIGDDNEVALANRSAQYRRLDLLVRALHCVDETNPESGDDDMVLGGVLIGAGGNIATARALVCGTFDDGDYYSYGLYPFGMFSLRSTPSYPKTFYAIFYLVESDSDDAEVAQALTQALAMVGQIVGTAYAGAAGGALVSAIINTAGNFISMFIDEDRFPPYAIQLVLNNQNGFNGNASSSNIATGNIRGHGGTYRIGYKWHLAA
jgi:hypothetical protein